MNAMQAFILGIMTPGVIGLIVLGLWIMFRESYRDRLRAEYLRGVDDGELKYYERATKAGCENLPLVLRRIWRP